MIVRARVRAALRRGLASAIAASVVTALVACVPEPSTPRGPDVAAAFTEHGIAVLDDVSQAWSDDALMASPAYAVEVMQAEIDSRGGMPGADLDELVPMPPGAPSFSYLVAAWLSEQSTPRAQAARGWLAADIEWSRAPSVWYPRAALLLFVADAMEASITDFGMPETSPTPAPSSLGPAGGTSALASISVPLAGPLTIASPRDLLSAPCSSVSDFFARTINQIFSAVQLPPDFLASEGVLGAISGFLAALYNTAVQLAQQAVVTVINTLTAPALRAIASGVAIAGVVSHLSTYVLGVSMSMVSSETPVRLNGEPGSWFGLIDANRPLEAQLNDCLAALKQKPLPDLVREGAAITWLAYAPAKADRSAYPGSVLLYPQPTASVDEAKRVVIPWVAGTEAESSRPEEIGSVSIKAEVARAEITDLFATARGIIENAISSVASNAGVFSNQVKAVIRASIGSILFPIIDRIEKEILGVGRSILTIVGSGQTTFVYHEPDEPTPPSGAAVPNCYVGSWRYAGVASAWLDLSRSSFQRFTVDIGADGSYGVRAVGWAVYREGVGGFWTSYEGSTRYTTAAGPEGAWVVTAPRLSASESYAALYVPLGNGYVLGGDGQSSGLPYREVPSVIPGTEVGIPAEDAGLPQTSPGDFGNATFGAGLRPMQFSCNADGSTLTITGEADGTYGAAVWTFRRA